MTVRDRTGKVYTASIRCLEDPALFDRLLGQVPPARRQKVQELKNPVVRRRSLGAGALLMRAVADFTAAEGMEAERAALPAEDPDRIRIAMGEHGKPYFPDCPQIRFSLSHSGDMVMCAVSAKEVGCDVEEVSGWDRRKLVMRCLTPYEQELVREDPDRFYRIWTLKESFLKLTGKGLLIPLSSFEVKLDPPEIRQDIISTDVELKEYTGQTGYRYACAGAALSLPGELVCIDLAAGQGGGTAA